MSAQSVEIRADHGLDAANAVESEFIPVEAVNPGAGRVLAGKSSLHRVMNSFLQCGRWVGGRVPGSSPVLRGIAHEMADGFGCLCGYDDDEWAEFFVHT